MSRFNYHRVNWLTGYTSLVFLFLYLPIFILVIFSFNESRQTAVWKGFTWEWYAKLMHNPAILKSLVNSLKVATLTGAVSVILGTLIAIALDGRNFPGRKTTQNLLYVPMVTPEVVLGAALVTFFGILKWQAGSSTVILAHIGFCLSYAALVIKARLNGMDASLTDAAMDLGASPISAFFRVTLPQLYPGILASFLLVFTVSMDDYVITSFVAGPGSTTLPLQIYSMIRIGITPEINAISTVLLVWTMILIVLAQIILQKGKPSNRITK